MELSSLNIVIAMILMPLCGSLLVIWAVGFIRPSKVNDAAIPLHDFRPTNTFLLRGDTIIDHDIDEMPPYLQDIEELRDWSDLKAWLGLRFDGLPKSLIDSPDQEHVYVDKIEEEPRLGLKLTKQGETTRIALVLGQDVSGAAWHCASQAAYLSVESKNTLDHVSFPIWKSNASGDLIWRNTAMASVIGKLGGVPNVIPASGDSTALPRFSVPQSSTKPPSWYEVETQKISTDETLHIATGIDQVVRAETAQRDFVQTLTKTFANLTTGLTVFDKNRQLALFNPALVDLTGISVSFLSGRPDVIRFFDELRERQVLPEPKNYASFRTHIREVIAKANEGNYLETWNLPGGVTYRVTGRPHPDGAVAFLIEDISAEVLKTRQFRTQIDLSQSVIDGLEEAIIVIAPNDLVLLCNTACSDLLKIDPANSFADMTVSDLFRACGDQFQSDSLWSIFETSVNDASANSNCHDRFLNMRRGGRLQYRIKLLPGGARMIGFSKVLQVETSPSFTAA
ncbi:MAG: PAS-domain containing protein [Roseovarius sp.]